MTSKRHDHLKYRMGYLPQQLQRARALHKALVAEAKRYGMFDILTEEEKAT